MAAHVISDPKSVEIDRTGLRFWPFWLVPGVTRFNMTTLLFASFFAIGLNSFVNVFQPYILTEHLGILAGTEAEPGEQGRVTTLMGNLQEIIILLLIAPIGALSDKIGRRNIFAAGFALIGVGYILYPLATSVPELLSYRFIYAIGAACIIAMLATIQADYPQEPFRGKMVSVCGMLQGIGVVAAIFTLTRLPDFYAAFAGEDKVLAGRYSLWTVAALCFMVSMAIRLGLRPGAPNVRPTEKKGIVQLLRVGFSAARNPRIALSFGAAFVSRGDLVIVSNFFSLWLLQAAMGQGLDAGEAMGELGRLYGLVQLCAVMWAPFMGILIDRLNRVTAVCVALVLATVGYLSVGFVSDPFGSQMIIAAVLLGMGEISGVLASQSLIGQEAPASERGSVFGFFGLSGAIGIIVALTAGGFLFDYWMPAGPFVFMGVLNAVLLVVAITVRVFWGTEKEPQSQTAPAE